MSKPLTVTLNLHPATDLTGWNRVWDRLLKEKPEVAASGSALKLPPQENVNATKG